MQIEVIQAGSFTTIQDGGRLGYAHLGVPVSGFMDERSAHLANCLVGNQLGDALLELTWTGLEFVCHADCSMALAGAEFECFLNAKPVYIDTVIQLKVGDHFKMGRLLMGVRGYMAFAGSFDLPPIAGSLSTLVVAGLGGHLGRQIETGDLLKLRKPSLTVIKHLPFWKKLKPQSTHVIRAIPGPEFNDFKSAAVRQAFGQSYQLSNDCNRQGFRLLAETIESPKKIKMVSSGLVPGSLQVTPDGQTILAMRDAQTTGGYPRILIVNQNQLHQIAQIRPGENIYFFVTHNQ